MFEWIATWPLIGPTLSFALPAVFAFAIVVAVHEYGHYIVGRWCGIYAEVFSLGFGPRLWQRRDKHGTIWQISAIPLGGYVRFLGDMNAASMPAETQSKDPQKDSRMFQNATIGRKFLTVLAGPVANFILSCAIFTALALWFGAPAMRPIINAPIDMGIAEHTLREGDEILRIDGQAVASFDDIIEWTRTAQARDSLSYQVRRADETLGENQTKTLTVQGPFPLPAVVGSVLPVTAASRAGVRVGDVIRAINGQSVTSFAEIGDLIAGSETEAITLRLYRDGGEFTAQITPRLQITQSEGEIIRKKLLGIRGGFAFTPRRESLSLPRALWRGMQATWGVITGSVQSLQLLFSGTVGLSDLQGPIGIAHSASDIAKSGWAELFSFIAIISTAIGFFNLLPIPVLDGGHLLHFAYQMLVGRELPARGLAMVTNFGLVLLLAVMVFVSFYDGSRLFSG